ncbi:hypothetical protein SEA_LIFES_44 [Microbacterium phage Lifes]|nr:hypothetical protein SEA_LIFES_44 [Microbacterium phage Lifes]
MATTSPDNIWTPDAGDDYALTTDLAAMADTIQDAITANNNNLSGLDANRPANGSPGLANGMTWYSTDTRVTWRYDGSTWSIEFRPLSSYTPAVAGITAGQITTSGKYERRGNYIDGFVTITKTGSGVLSGTVSVTLPTTPLDASTPRNLGDGTARVVLSGATTDYILDARYTGGSAVNLNIPDPSGGALTAGTNLSSSFPTSGSHLAGSTYYITFSYESA